MGRFTKMPTAKMEDWKVCEERERAAYTARRLMRLGLPGMAVSQLQHQRDRESWAENSPKGSADRGVVVFSKAMNMAAPRFQPGFEPDARVVATTSPPPAPWWFRLRAWWFEHLEAGPGFRRSVEAGIARHRALSLLCLEL